MLTEKEIPPSYADREWFNPLLKMHTLACSFVLNAQGYFDLSIRDALLAGGKSFPIWKRRLSGPWLSFPRFPLGSI